jgi:hypothetical protein
MLLIALGQGSPHRAIAQSRPEEVETVDYEVADIYADLRNRVLQLQPSPNDSDAAVSALLMETGYPEAVATLVAVADGSVSMYFSNGGGIIGAGEHAPVRQVAQKLLSTAESYVARASRAAEFPLPTPGNVRFYFVTAKGVVTVEAAEDDLGYGRHAFSTLFHQAHELIAAIREHSPP